MNSMRNKKKAIVILSTVGGLVILGLAGWLLWPTLTGLFNRSETTPVSEEQAEPVDSQTQQYITIQQEAAKVNAAEGPAATEQYLDTQIAESKTDADKAVLLIMKSNVVSADTTKAIDYGQQAEETDSTFTSASNLASLYEMSGDTDNALKYYRLMLERADPSYRTDYPDDYTRLQNKIKFLEAK